MKKLILVFAGIVLFATVGMAVTFKNFNHYVTVTNNSDKSVIFYFYSSADEDFLIHCNKIEGEHVIIKGKGKLADNNHDPITESELHGLKDMYLTLEPGAIAQFAVHLFQNSDNKNTYTFPAELNLWLLSGAKGTATYTNNGNDFDALSVSGSEDLHVSPGDPSGNKDINITLGDQSKKI